MFQFHHLLPEFSVVENVMMPALIAGTGRPAELRSRARSRRSRRSGSADVADKNANEISGGQKQRVAIARALMNRPQLVLADEPTGNLDTENSELVYELFRKVNRDWGTAFLIVTHDRADRAADRPHPRDLDGELVQDVRNPCGLRRAATRRAP